MFRIDERKTDLHTAPHGLSESRPGEATNPALGGTEAARQRGRRGGPSQGVAPLGGWRREMHAPGCQQLGEVARNGRPATNNRREMQHAPRRARGLQGSRGGPPSGAGDGDALGVAPMAFATRLASIRRQRGSYRIWYMALTPATLCGKV